MKDIHTLLSQLTVPNSKKSSPSGKKRADKKRAGRSAVENDADDDKLRPSTGEELSSNETDSSHAGVSDTTPRSKKGRRSRRQRRIKQASESRAPVAASGLSDDALTPTWGGPEIKAFSELPFSAALLQGVLASPAGEGKPTKFQRTVLPALMTEGNVVVQARGVDADDGKTVAVAAAALHKIKPTLKTCQVLLLTSSRESAKQLHREVLALSTFIRPRLTCHLSIGGTSIRDDLRDMCAGCHVVVGTLGRAFDMLRRGALRASDLKMVVLDDIDTMMTRRFDKDHIYAVLGDVTAEAEGLQVVMLHSMMHEDIPKAISLFATSPVKVLVQGEAADVSSVTVTSSSERQLEEAVQKLTEKLGQVTLPEIVVDDASLPQAMAECVVEGC